MTGFNIGVLVKKVLKLVIITSTLFSLAGNANRRISWIFKAEPALDL